MSAQINRVIVVTCHSENEARRVHKIATDICGKLVSPLVAGLLEDVYSFFVASNGSKDGWPTEDRSRIERDEFIKWLRDPQSDTNTAEWVYVEYGCETHNGLANILASDQE